MAGHAGPQQLLKLARPFRVVAFDWDGTAVGDRYEDATAVGQRLERLMSLGVAVVVLTGGDLERPLRQLAPLVQGRHNQQLFIAANRGSEIFGFDGGPVPIPLWRRVATAEEERQLTEAADALRDELQRRTGLPVAVIYDRLNRRKVDLIPEPEWADPPRSQTGELLTAVQQRLTRGGIDGGLPQVLSLARNLARAKGLADPRITTDGKHVEIGLTDKSDSIEWMFEHLCRERGIAPEDALIGGDEFGPIGGAEGNDSRMLTPHSTGAVFVSVGAEPGGVADGIIHLGGGPARFLELLGSLGDLHQVRLRAPAAALELPLAPVADAHWRICRPGLDPAREHEFESIFAIANGYLGARGSLDESELIASSPATLLAGIYDALPEASAVPELAVGPEWSRLLLASDGQPFAAEGPAVLEHLRTLDLAQGALFREWRHRDRDGRITFLRAVRLASLADRHLLLQSLLIVPENYSGTLSLEAIVEPARLMVNGMPVPRPRMIPAYDAAAAERRDPSVLVYRVPGSGTSVALACQSRLHGPQGELPATRVDRAEGVLRERWELEVRLGERYRFDKLAAFYSTRESRHPVPESCTRVESLRLQGTDGVARRHGAAWRERWAATDITVEGDEEAQRALRFAAYHLISAANPEDERVSIGARTLSGRAYKGHVFWDTDTFILPMFSYTCPQAARSLLMYRFHTLPAAREKARGQGRQGALFAWESADTGVETTPRFMLAPDGEMLRILCGEQELHVSADVAYAAWQYWGATGDQRFMAEAGAELMLETARFWASRAEPGKDGRLHLRGVIGPDEYHETVDDNGYTNGMAQWNLEAGALAAKMMRERMPARWRELKAKLSLDEAEVESWLGAAPRLAPRIDPKTSLIEQYDGFFKLEDYDLSPLRKEGRRAAPLDLLLGRDKVQRSRIVKQADVVMLEALLWDRLPPEAREACFRYYEPRTCHGSSLSPAVHSWVAAKLGMMDVAESYFRQAARIDLSDEMGNAAGGVHAAAMGGLWQAAVFGFAGVHPRGDGLLLSPRLPSSWQAMRVPLQWRGARLMLTMTRRPGELSARVLEGGPVAIELEGVPRRQLECGQELRARREGEDRWSARR